MGNDILDFEVLADNVDMYRFLFDELGILCLGVSGDNYIMECPDPTHIDKNPSCYFHKSNLVYHCFGCGSKGTIIDLVTYYRDMERDDSVKFLKKRMGLEHKTTTDTFRKRYSKKVMPNFRLSDEYRRDWENADSRIQDFIRERDFDTSVFDSYYIGYDNSIGAIVIPIVYGKSIVNIGCRFVFGNEKTKIRYRKGAPLSLSVWGLFDDYDPVNPYFTEGVFDAIRMRQAGINAYALLSTVLTTSKIRFLSDHFEGVWTIVPDPDKGGEKMVEYWMKAIHASEVRVMELIDEDPDRTPIPVLQRLSKHTRPIQEYKLGNFVVRNDVCSTIRGR